VNAGRLEVFDSGRNISCHSEVRILVDTLRNEAGDVSSLSEDMGEGVGIAWGGLDSGISNFTAVVTFVQTEDSLKLEELGSRRRVLG
jgi:hypothetical protein